MKILIEIFCPKLIVSNVISAFLDHLKPKIFFAGQPWGRHRAPPLLKISGSAPVRRWDFVQNVVWTSHVRIINNVCSFGHFLKTTSRHFAAKLTPKFNVHESFIWRQGIHGNVLSTLNSNWQPNSPWAQGVSKAFKRRPGGFLNVLCMFNLRPVRRGTSPVLVNYFH